MSRISRWILALEYYETEAVHKHNDIHRAWKKMWDKPDKCIPRNVDITITITVRKHLTYAKNWLTHVAKTEYKKFSKADKPAR